MELSDLPRLNACLNAACAVLLLFGYAFIRRRPPNVRAHAACMLGAFFVSSAFLASYLYYHFHHPTTRFATPGWPKAVYYAILFPHILLATIEVPLILVTLYRAVRGDFVRHRRLARWTLPVWLYVSVTGVLVYLMLYVWFPSAP